MRLTQPSSVKRTTEVVTEKENRLLHLFNTKINKWTMLKYTSDVKARVMATIHAVHHTSTQI
ncbi:MAG: hypothetical protein QXV17_11510 [Candidatus Micrarchaeaceae archaeon]